MFLNVCCTLINALFNLIFLIKGIASLDHPRSQSFWLALDIPSSKPYFQLGVWPTCWQKNNLSCWCCWCCWVRLLLLSMLHNYIVGLGAMRERCHKGNKRQKWAMPDVNLTRNCTEFSSNKFMSSADEVSFSLVHENRFAAQMWNANQEIKSKIKHCWVFHLLLFLTIPW